MTAATCGIDIGGTKIAGAVVSADGEILAADRIESPAVDPAALKRAVAELVGSLAAQHPIRAVGVAAAGFVDRDRSTVRFAPNIAWRDEPLGSDLADLVGLPVVVENDANAAAWGEFRHGAGRDADDQLMITLGTGVGGGVVIDGRLLRGAYGAGAEVGHLCVVPDGHLCGCGNRGCLEMYASGTALVRNARAASGDPSLTGPEVMRRAQAGDPFAIEQYAEIGRWIGHGLASLVAVLDPALIVVGGGVGEAGDLVLEPARAAFRAELTGRGHRPEAPIVHAELGNDAGVIGAADLARTTRA
ncbi:ROK family glucokinase [Nocardioides montaniterrae]